MADANPGVLLELPTQHRIPLTWLLANGGESIRYRTYRELAPAGSVSPETLAAAQQAVVDSKAAAAIVKKQKDTGVWAGNMLGLGASAKDGTKDVGTIPQYRRLLQLGYPLDSRPFRLANRLFFRLLSHDPDPALLYEFQSSFKADPDATAWARETLRDAAAAALAESSHVEDPRLRGAGHKIATAVSQFLRGPLAERPFVRSGQQTVLHPEAHPPTWYSVAMLAAMPNLRRERAGFTERLVHYLAQPAPKKAYVVRVGKKSVKPKHLLLGDPIVADAKGVAKDLPLALHYIELLARMGAREWAPVLVRVLARLVRECDDEGVWHPKGLRSKPKATDKITYHYYPLQIDDKSVESRSADVTFRLALIARLLEWDVEYT